MLAPLFVACVNVGLLILAQTSTRASEFAVRTALGAGRGRILTQVFVEFMVLAVMAAGAGLLILDWLPGRLLTALGITLPVLDRYGAERGHRTPRTGSGRRLRRHRGRRARRPHDGPVDRCEHQARPGEPVGQSPGRVVERAHRD